MWFILHEWRKNMRFCVEEYLVAHPTKRKWGPQPWLFSWDKWGFNVHKQNWGELTHNHDSWVVHHQVMNTKWWTGWWFQPLWKIWKSVGMIIPNIWENKKWQPNHQPNTKWWKFGDTCYVSRMFPARWSRRWTHLVGGSSTALARPAKKWKKCTGTAPITRIMKQVLSGSSKHDSRVRIVS